MDILDIHADRKGRQKGAKGESSWEVDWSILNRPLSPFAIRIDRRFIAVPSEPIKKKKKTPYEHIIIPSQHENIMRY